MVRLLRPLRGLFATCSALALAGCSGDIIESATEFGDEVEDSGGDSSEGSQESGGSTGESTSTGSETSSSSTSESTSESTSSTTESTSESTSSTTESTSESTSSSTTESTSESGVDTTCNSEMSFLIPATAYVDGYGWEPYMSMLGEGMVITVPNEMTEAVANYELDIPCDDTWHIWVRAVDYLQYDSLWVMVDGQPANWGIFEVDCTDGPNQSTYKWNELNLRDQAASPCQYVEDPWTQNWSAGIHTLSLGYRDSVAISKIWFTNGNGTPP